MRSFYFPHNSIYLLCTLIHMKTIFEPVKTVVTGIVYPNLPHKKTDIAIDIATKVDRNSLVGLRPYDLVKVSGLDLGFDKPVTREQINSRAKDLGLALCPQGLGPLLRNLYPDQPLYEWLLMAMEPIPDSDGAPHIFSLGHIDDLKGIGTRLWLSAVSGLDDYRWAPSYIWVFVVPRG